MKKLALSALLVAASVAAFADSGTSKTAAVTLNIADFMEIVTPGAGLDSLVVNVTGDPTGAEFRSSKANFSVRSNRSWLVGITATSDPEVGVWEYLFGSQDGTPNGSTYLQGATFTADAGEAYSLQALVSGLKLSDGTASKSGTVTISMSIPN